MSEQIDMIKWINLRNYRQFLIVLHSIDIILPLFLGQKITNLHIVVTNFYYKIFMLIYLQRHILILYY